MLCLTAVSANSNNVRKAVTSTPASSHNQRRELGVSDWWYTLLNLLHAPCPSDHDHTLTPHGHCAHHSHHPSSSHHSSGGSSHSSSSNGGSSGGGGGGGGCGGSDDCWDDDGHHDDGEWGDDGHHDDDKWGDDGHEWGDDGHVEDDKWDVSSVHSSISFFVHTYKQRSYTIVASLFLTQDDGYHDDDKYSYWAGDAHNDDGGSSSHWWSQKSYATSGYNNADDNGSSSSMKSKLLWPLTVLGALFVGLIALVVSRVRAVCGVIHMIVCSLTL